MAYTTINKSTDYFNTVTYTGNGSANTALTTGTFQPDWVWFKNRGTTETHLLMDAVRGATKYIQSATAAAEGTSSDKISAFTSTGVTLGSGAETNENNQPLVCWNWKANGQGSSNTDGTINSTYTSANTTSGFSIIKYTGTGSAGTVGHGLGQTLDAVIVKKTSGDEDWNVWIRADTPKIGILNETNAFYSPGSAGIVGSTITSSVLGLGTGATANGSGATYVAYCFAEKQGFSKFGKYTGNGEQSDNAFVYTGFKPAFVIIKRQDQATNWVMFDTARDTYNEGSKVLLPDNSAAETSGSQKIDFLSNGFKIRSSGNNTGDSSPYTYICFAEAPLVGSNNVP